VGERERRPGPHRDAPVGMARAPNRPGSGPARVTLRFAVSRAAPSGAPMSAPVLYQMRETACEPEPDVPEFTIPSRRSASCANTLWTDAP
jgi:hypothetical protein